jgi:DNA-directed RNA polymerase subunit M/transcription elongation factor TFIIS
MTEKIRTTERDEDGLFQTYCEQCGAIVFSAQDNEPFLNCDECPGHDDIARRDQEAADKAEKE